METHNEKARGDFDTLLRNPEMEKRAEQSTPMQYTDNEIEQLSNQEPLCTSQD